MRPSLPLAVTVLAALCLLTGVPLMAQATSRLFIPIGGGYADTFAGVFAAARARDRDDRLTVIVLPVTYASSAGSISDEERAQNLADADERRAQLETACREQAAEDATCAVSLAPVFTRADAEDPANVTLLAEDSDLDVVFILGGDQIIAMQALAGTPLEAALAAAYERGVIIAGTSAGLAVQSRAMIGGYSSEAFGPDNALKRGAVDLWNDGDSRRRGLSFGLSDVILEQHFWERARLARLLNALAQPGAPPIGIGVDGYTAAQITNETRLDGIFGLYGVMVVDAATFGAADSAAFNDGLLSMRNVLFHTLAPGDFAYDLTTHRHSLAAPPAALNRDYTALALPDAAGPLLLAGSLLNAPANDSVLPRFTELSGGAGARVLVVLFASNDSPLAAAYAARLQAAGLPGAQFVYLPDDNAELNAAAYDGLIIAGDDASRLSAEPLADIAAAWRGGQPLLLDGAAAALAGVFYAAHPPTPFDGDDASIEAATQGSLIQGSTLFRPGLGLLNITLEARVMADNRWGRLVALAYQHPDVPALALNDGAALEIAAGGARVLGSNGLVLFDLSAATLALGDNGGYVIANGLLDVFAPGETVKSNP